MVRIRHHAPLQRNIMSFRSNSQIDAETAAKLWPSSKISRAVPPSRESCPIASSPSLTSSGTARTRSSSPTRTPPGSPNVVLLYRDREPTLEIGETGRPWSFDGDGAAVPPGLRGAPHPPRPPVRPAARRPHLDGRPAAAPDHRRLRRDAAAPAAALPAGRRSRRRQDDHGRAAHQGAADPRRPAALPDRLPRQPRRAVAGRALPAVPASRSRSSRTTSSKSARTGNWFAENRLVICRLDKLCRNEDVQAKLAQHRLGPRRLRRGAQDVGHLLRRRGQVHQALPARPAPRPAHAALPADDGDAAQRQGGGLPALHGAARRRPLRGPVPRRRAHRRRLRPDAPDGQGAAAQVRRHAALPRAARLHRPLQALRRRGRTSTRASPTTSARSSTAPTRWRTKAARARSASP